MTHSQKQNNLDTTMEILNKQFKQLLLLSTTVGSITLEFTFRNVHVVPKRHAMSKSICSVVFYIVNSDFVEECDSNVNVIYDCVSQDLVKLFQ